MRQLRLAPRPRLRGRGLPDPDRPAVLHQLDLPRAAARPLSPPLGPARWADLDPALAYAIARLRVDVFVVEQACAYPELDGRDLEEATEHRWLPGPSGEPVGAYLRVLLEPSGERRIGRVVTAPGARGHGLSGRLVAAVVADHGGPGGTALVLDAQAHLEHWYARFGFAPSGPPFTEDGIPHVPMRRPPG